MLKGYKTVIFNIIVMILPVMDAINVTQILSPQGACYYSLFVAIGNAILRFYTDSPIFKDADAGAIQTTIQ